MPAIRFVKQALPRLLLAFAAMVAAVQLFRLLLLPAIQSVFDPGPDVTSGLRRAGVFVCAVLAYWAYVRFVEKRRVHELQPAPLAVVVGGLSGALLIAVAMAVLFAIGAYEATAYLGFHPGLWNVAVVILIAAMLEEIAYRGILFGILESSWGTGPALWLSSLVFALMHLGNVDDRASTQELLTTVVTGTLLGAFWTLIYVLTRNLWVVAANHAAWNFTIILSGLPLSGLDTWRRVAPLASEYRGPGWLTGGVFGPEDSVVTVLLVTTTVVAMWRLAKARKKGTEVITPT